MNYPSVVTDDLIIIVLKKVLIYDGAGGVIKFLSAFESFNNFRYWDSIFSNKVLINDVIVSLIMAENFSQFKKMFNEWKNGNRYINENVEDILTEALDYDSFDILKLLINKFKGKYEEEISIMILESAKDTRVVDEETVKFMMGLDNMFRVDYIIGLASPSNTTRSDVDDVIKILSEYEVKLSSEDMGKVLTLAADSNLFRLILSKYRIDLSTDRKYFKAFMFALIKAQGIEYNNLETQETYDLIKELYSIKKYRK